MDILRGRCSQQGAHARHDVSGFFSSTGSRPSRAGSRPARRLSGWRCSSTLWFGWNSGSNQNQRSAGASMSIFTSAMRKRSRKMRPLLSSPMSWRIAERPPSHAAT
jgi:hypothetical protein